MTICSLEKNQFIGLTWCEELDRYEYKMTRSATAHTNIDGARNYPTLKADKAVALLLYRLACRDSRV